MAARTRSKKRRRRESNSSEESYHPRTRAWSIDDEGESEISFGDYESSRESTPRPRHASTATPSVLARHREVGLFIQHH